MSINLQTGVSKNCKVIAYVDNGKTQTVVKYHEGKKISDLNWPKISRINSNVLKKTKVQNMRLLLES